MNVLLVRFFAMAAIVAPTIADAATLLPAYTFPDGSAGFEFLTSGGPTNPGVLVGFNPQPDPPGVPTVTADLRDPTSPVFAQTTKATAYLVTVSLLLPGTPGLLLPAVLGDGSVTATCDGSVSKACDGSVFKLSLAFRDITSWSLAVRHGRIQSFGSLFPVSRYFRRRANLRAVDHGWRESVDLLSCPRTGDVGSDDGGLRFAGRSRDAAAGESSSGLEAGREDAYSASAKPDATGA